MPFSELTISFILDEAEGKKDMGDELLLRTCRTIPRRVANYRKEISPSIEPRYLILAYIEILARIVFALVGVDFSKH